MSDSVLREKSKEFAKQIVFLCKNIKHDYHESVPTNQLLRSGTSICANIHEEQYPQGTKDFISKFEISLKEVYETSTGLSCYLKQDILTNKCTNRYKIVAER